MKKWGLDGISFIIGTLFTMAIIAIIDIIYVLVNL